MKKAILYILIIIPFTVFAADGLGSILQKPDTFDKKTVVIEAEVVGEVLKAEGGNWLNVTSGPYSVGVFVDQASLLEGIETFGSYRKQGDRVRIEGTFYKNCPRHAERAIHARRIMVIEKGYVRQESVPPLKYALAILLAILCLTLLVIYFIKIKYARRKN